MSSENKNIYTILTVTAIGLGVWGAYSAINSKIEDYRTAIKFALANFKFSGFEKAPNGKLNIALVNVVLEYNIVNLSNSSLSVPDLMLSVEYQGEDKNYYSFAYSKAPIAIRLNSKSTTRIAFPIQVSVQDLIASRFYRLILKPVNYRITAYYTVMGFKQTTSREITFSFPYEITQLIRLYSGKISGVNDSFGMTAQTQRKLRDGDEYTRFIDGVNKPDKKTYLNKNAETEEVVAQIVKIAKEVSWQTRKLSKILYNRDALTLAKNIYQFIYRHIQYRLDKEGEEELREPARLWRERKSGGDCDCYALMVSTLLMNLGIRHYFRVIKMSNKSAYQHIYVVIPLPEKKYIWYDPKTYVIIDPVMEYFDGKDPHGITGVLDYRAL